MICWLPFSPGYVNETDMGESQLRHGVGAVLYYLCFFFWLAGVGAKLTGERGPGAFFSLDPFLVPHVVKSFSPSPPASRGLFLFLFFAQSPVSSLEVPINLGTLLSPAFASRMGLAFGILGGDGVVRCVRFCHKGGLSDGRTKWGWMAMGNISCYFTTAFALLFTETRREGRCL